MPKESDFQSKIIKLINDNYGICIKYNVDYKAKAGMPDLFAAVNNYAIFIEVKKEGEKPTPIQVAQMKRIKKKATKFVFKIGPEEYLFLIDKLNEIKKGEI